MKFDEGAKPPAETHHGAALMLQMNDRRCRKIIGFVAEIGDPPAVIGIDMIGETPVKAADQVAALVRSLRIDDATFYGCSSGGIVVLGLIAVHPDLVANGIVHEVAINADYRSGKSESLLPSLCALTDDEVVEQCRMIFRELMNDDAAAWASSMSGVRMADWWSRCRPDRAPRTAAWHEMRLGRTTTRGSSAIT